MAKSATTEEEEQPGSPMEFKEHLSIQQVKEVGEEIGKHAGELCLCALQHSHIVRERNPFYGGPRGRWGILAPEEEFTHRRVFQAHLFVWKATVLALEPRPDGVLIIPAKRHLRSRSQAWPWSVLGIWEFEHIEGPIQHKLLKHEPFDPHPELPLHPSAVPPPRPPDYFALLQTIARVMVREEGETSDHEVKVAFHFGDQPVYDRVFKSGLEAHAASHPTLAAQTIKDVEFLGSPLPPDLLDLAADGRKHIQRELLKKTVECLSQGQSLDGVAKEYRQWVGGRLKQLTLGQFSKLLTEAEEDVP